MPDAVQILGTPPLRKQWQDAKKLSESLAAKSKETSKLADLHKNKMKGALGPDLENWPKNYPRWDKLQSEKTKIDTTLKTYTDAVNGSGLTDAVKKPLATALKDIKTAMGVRLAKAEELINSDLKLGTKLSKKAIPPIIIFQLDVASIVDKKAGGKTRLKADHIPLEVILSDDKVLKNVPADLDNGHLAESIRTAAGFQTITDELAKLLIAVSQTALDPGAAQNKFLEGMDKVIQEALARAAKPILELTEVRSDYTMYKVKKGATLTLATAGVIASVVSMAATPFTGGVSTVAGIVGIIKSVHTIAVEVDKLAMSCEVFIDKVTDDLKTLYSQYKKVNDTAVGAGELGKTVINALVGPFFTTVTDTKDNCDQVKDKINGLFVKTNDQAVALGALLTGQTKLNKEVAEFEQANKGKLTAEESKLLAALKTKLEKTEPAIDSMIKGIRVLHKRFEDNKGAYAMLSAAVNEMSAREPTWAKLGEVLIKVAAAAGFLVAGNVHAPEALEFLKVTKTVAENASRVLESVEALKELAVGLNDALKKHK